MRNYLLKGVAALTMGLAMTACTKEFNYEKEEQQAAVDNAQQTLGFYIPENQDWVMTSSATATFNVKGLSDDATAYVFSNNPYADGYGAVLASAPVTSSTTTISDFRIPQHLKMVYVGLKESDGNMVYKYVDVEDGKINASYDFSTTPATTRTRSMIREIDDPFPSFTPSEVDAKYKTSAPSTALTWDEAIEAITTHYQYYDNVDYNKLNDLTEFYFIDGTYSMNVWYGSRDIYIGGNVIMNVDKTQALNQARFYLLPNSTLSLNMDNEGYINNLEIYVAQNATLNYNYSMLYKQTGGGVIFNRGTINLPDNFQANNDAIVYNEGTVIGGDITSAPGSNNPSFFYNFGSLELSGALQLNSCANFYNEGTVTVGDVTECTQGSGQVWWINKGHYTTRRFGIMAWNGTFYNYCQLFIQEDASLHDGQFNLMPNGYMEAATAEINNFQINMYGNTGLNIKGDNHWIAQSDGIYQGFMAYGENNYVRLGGTTNVDQHHNTLVAQGNVFIGFDNLYAPNSDNPYDGPYVDLRENTKKVQFSELNPSYNETDCGASWTADPQIDTPVVENQTWTYAFEDNKTRCDFDMNDVVIQVRENEENENELIVTLVAAGCEYDNYVWLGYDIIEWPKGKEVHDAFGINHGVMVNTGNGKGVDLDPVSITIPKPANFDFQNPGFKIRAFKINSDPTNEDNARSSFVEIVQEGNPSGLPQAPVGIAIPDKWKWPKERVNVTNAYEGFVAWGSQEDITLRAEEGGWYQEPANGLVYGE